MNPFRSLFIKTLLWFLATTAIAISAFTVTTALAFRSSESRQSPFTRLLNLQVEDAKRAYETGGRDALAAALARFQSAADTEAVLTDADGRDLLTGKLRPDLKKRMGQRRRRPPIYGFLMPPPSEIVRHDATRQFWLFIQDVRPNSGNLFWFLQPQHLWVIGLVVLLCYAFAYHLTYPVRQLQRAVDCFGRGDLSARAKTNRRDELGQLARTFNVMADRTQTLLKAERRLLQDISHELRSPLARLGVAIELARSGGTGPSTFDRIEREAERLNALVGELLQVTRVEGDPSQQKQEPVALDQVLADLVYDSELEAKAKECRIVLTTHDTPTVLGDDELLRRAIENVLRNAIRYAPANTEIEIGLTATGSNAAIRIRDHGPGVPEESLSRIFDAFYRVDSDRNRNSGGVGLGLAIARRAIELHKGTLRAENGRPGLIVTIELPTAPGIPAQAKAEEVLSTS